MGPMAKELGRSLNCWMELRYLVVFEGPEGIPIDPQALVRGVVHKHPVNTLLVAAEVLDLRAEHIDFHLHRMIIPVSLPNWGLRPQSYARWVCMRKSRAKVGTPGSSPRCPLRQGTPGSGAPRPSPCGRVWPVPGANFRRHLQGHRFCSTARPGNHRSLVSPFP